jgi:hypothetical protein
MAGIPDTMTTPPAEEGYLPANPFTALSFHFGMLLGVDDFETEQGYHLGKSRLENAWLHGEGVVWGLDVESDSDHNEIRVQPGLALDAAGRELHLDALACVDVGAWYDKHKDDAGFEAQTVGVGGVTFDAHVVAIFRACLARQVPAIAEACSDPGTSTAYSRVNEAVELRLVPGLAPPRDPSTDPYRRLRVFFGLAAPASEPEDVASADAAVVAERQRIAGLTADAQPPALLAAFRRFAALDEEELAPPGGDDGTGSLLFPAGDDAQVVLADIPGITLQPAAGGGWQLLPGVVDTSVRRTLVAASTLQELLLATLLTQIPALATAAVAGVDGPRVTGTPTFDGKTITIEFTKPLAASSLSDEGFRVSTFDGNAGWKHLKISNHDYTAGSTTVKLTLRTAPTGDVIRLLVRGTGTAPLLGEDLTPIWGAVGGPAGTANDGVDYVLMHRQGS